MREGWGRAETRNVGFPIIARLFLSVDATKGVLLGLKSRGRPGICWSNYRGIHTTDFPHDPYGQYTTPSMRVSVSSNFTFRPR